MYVYCVESFAHIECHNDCSCRGSHLDKPLCYVMFTVCSAVTVKCCVLYPCCVGVFGMFAVMYGDALLDRPRMVFHRMCVLCL